MDNSSSIKPPPHSKESEMMLLGSMLTSAHALNVATGALNEQDFYFNEHKLIFKVLKDAHYKGRPVEVHLIAEELKRLGILATVGDISYLTALAQYVGTSAYIEEYASKVRNKAIFRQIIDSSQDTIEQAYEEPEDPEAFARSQSDKLKRIADDNAHAADKFPIRSLDQFDQDFLLELPPPKPMLLEHTDANGRVVGFVPKNIVAMLVGAGGTGKTHFLAQLAISIASGTMFLDKYMPTIHCGDKGRGNVFFGLGENQYDDIHRVLFKASEKLRRTQPDLLKEDQLKEAGRRIFPLSFCGQQSSFIEKGAATRYFRDLKRQLMDQAPLGGWALVILDPVSRFLGAEAETDNAAATAFIALLEELSIDLPGHPTVLFAHHVNKGALNQVDKQNQSAARGSSALTDGVRLQLNLTKKRDSNDRKLVLATTKTNFTAHQGEITLMQTLSGFIELYSESVTNGESVGEPELTRHGGY